jgi:MFS family permease
VWHNRLLRSLAAMTGLYNFAASATFAVFVLCAAGSASAMGLSRLGYGVLLAAAAAGSGTGSFFAEQITRVLGRARSLLLTVPGGALLVGIPAITANPLLIGTGFFAGGVANIVWNVVAVSLRQQVTPDRLLGRMNCVCPLVARGVMPLGAVAGGLLAQLTGLRAVFAVMAALMLTLIVAMRTSTDDRTTTAEQEAETAPSQ